MNVAKCTVAGCGELGEADCAVCEQPVCFNHAVRVTADPDILCHEACADSWDERSGR